MWVGPWDRGIGAMGITEESHCSRRRAPEFLQELEHRDLLRGCEQ